MGTDGGAESCEVRLPLAPIGGPALAPIDGRAGDHDDDAIGGGRMNALFTGG